MLSGRLSEMPITPSSIPLHVARAYGLEVAQRAAAVKAVRTADHESLVAGRVPGQVSFLPDAASTDRSAGPYSLYNRAADKVEVAVAVQIGRTIDLTG